MEYDADVIRTFAKQLYAQAGRIVFVYAVVIGLMGAAAGYAATGDVSDGSSLGALVGLILGALVGYSVGTSRAFRLKLAAQTSLAQVQIEENTRPR